MIKLRAHHLLCLSRKYGSIGGWYNKKLFKHTKGILKDLQQNPNQIIQIKRACDDICEKCPNVNGNKCDKPSKYKINHWVKVMDNKTLRLINIRPDSKHKASDLVIKATKIKDKDIKSICKGCESLKYCLDLGLNKSFVKSIT